jgi:diketogulonate reductase-like aldo/keto reductase
MRMDPALAKRKQLNHGGKIPFLGLGVWQAAAGKETLGAVREALSCGYRLIDTASIYGNEKQVGEAVLASSLPPEEVFVTTKLWNSDHGYDATIRACRASLSTLGLPSIDLYLVHWPVEGKRIDTWKAMVALREEGLCRAVGVSNYTIAHLTELLDASPVVPAVNQVEFHPFLYQKELLSFCRKHGIVLEAYSPLTRGERLSDRDLVSIARKYGKSAAQILLRWALQHDVVVIPKSVNPGHIRENAQIFDFAISDDDMKALDNLDENRRYCWDPTDVS